MIIIVIIIIIVFKYDNDITRSLYPTETFLYNTRLTIFAYISHYCSSFLFSQIQWKLSQNDFHFDVNFPVLSTCPPA